MTADAKRLLAERLLRKQGDRQESQEARTTLASIAEQWDVAVLGGGLAGLSMALQLKQRRPELRVLVVEKARFPVREAAHKVGESTVEVGAHYFGEVLGLKRHLQTRQLKKLGLRFFFAQGDNREIHRRLEVGPFISQTLPVPSYQLDRGRFENYLGTEVKRVGGVVVDACRVRGVELFSRSGHRAEVGDQHQITIADDDGTERTVAARWIVDASGRASVLKRKLGLTLKNDHDTNAVWWRVDSELDLEDWTDDPRFRERMPVGYRRFSTNHLMGPGYWVWLIPLASGSTSVGIVCDAKMHPFTTMNTLELALEWLKTNEPLAHETCVRHLDGVQDFLVLRHYSHSCERSFSANRWTLVGDAGVFADPFYSPGSDFISFANSMSTELIFAEMDGEDVAERADMYQWLLVDVLFRSVMSVFTNQYPIMGNPRVMSAKIVWDFAVYWGIVGPLFMADLLGNMDMLRRLKPTLERFRELQTSTQAFFGAWHRDTANERNFSDDYIDLTRLDFLYRRHCAMRDRLEPDAFIQRLDANLDELQAVRDLMRGYALGQPGDGSALDRDLAYVWGRLHGGTP